MDSSISNMERWRGDTLYRVNEKGARVILRKRTKHLPKDLLRLAVREDNYEHVICK
jgi:hypothetical protein